VPFNPALLNAWTGFGVFAAEVGVLLLLAWLVLRRRDA
jgi:ABC-2 type transport system permease protein